MKLLFVTDNLSDFEQSTAPLKLLYRDCYFKQNVGFDAVRMEQFNFTSATTVEFKAAQRMHDEFEKLLPTLSVAGFVPNKYLKDGSKQEQLYAYFYDYFKKYLLLKHLFLLSLQQFLTEFHSEVSDADIELKLSRDLQLILPDVDILFPEHQVKSEFYSGELIRKFAPRFAPFKKLLYPVYNSIADTRNAIKPRIKKRKNHILLLTYDVSSDSLLLQHFFELVKQRKDVSLSIVQIATGMEARHTYSFKHFECDNIEVYRFEEFRKYARQNRNEQYFRHLCDTVPQFKCLDENQHFKAAELHYEWLGNMLEKIKPGVCLYTNQAEMGRALTHVAKFKKIPSVFVEYSFTFDSPFLRSKIPFTLRACINRLTANNWKRNDDPSLYHLVLGYCKHDFLGKQQPDKSAFFKANQLEPNQKTVLFASTWCSGNKIYDDEKAEIVRGLAIICHQNHWNLVVKKHPVEIDLVVDDVIKAQNFPHQKVFANAELSLADAVQMADFMCCQSSSAILDAVFFEKPFAFVSLTGGESLADYLFADKKNKIAEFHHLTDVEIFLKDLFNDAHVALELASKAKGLKRDLLYLADGMACKRLLEISMKLANNTRLDDESLVALQIEKV